MDDDVLHTLHTLLIGTKAKKHPKCKGHYDHFSEEFDCGYDTTLTCDECKYGVGRKDPEAKCNRVV
jgi:hypothetical protein